MEIKYSVIVPCYNDERIIKGTYHRIKTVMEHIGEPYEIIFVDDGSKDKTSDILRDICKNDSKHVIAILLVKNFGQHAAVSSGFDNSRGEIVITIDSDLETPPEEIPKLIEKFNEGNWDVVSGWRQIRGRPLTRTLGSKVINWLMGKVTGVKLNDYGCMLRLYKRDIIKLLNEYPEKTKVITALVSWLGARITEVKVAYEKHTDKKVSRYNFAKLYRISLDILTGYSVSPLHLVSFLGFGLAFVGFVVGCILIYYRIVYGAGPSGAVSFVALFLFMGGLQLIAIGIIGEYIGRIYTQVRQRPYYLISEILKEEDK